MTATRIDRGSTDSTAIYSVDGDLYFERTFDAPRERVWWAFTDPDAIPRWWGPHGTTTTVEEMDLRVGGRWRYRSSAPDRDDVVFFGDYLEITPPETLGWTFLGDGRTKVTSIGHMGSAEAIEGALATGMAKGAIETWDRLDALLAEV